MAFEVLALHFPPIFQLCQKCWHFIRLSSSLKCCSSLSFLCQSSLKFATVRLPGYLMWWSLLLIVQLSLWWRCFGLCLISSRCRQLMFTLAATRMSYPIQSLQCQYSSLLYPWWLLLFLFLFKSAFDMACFFVDFASSFYLHVCNNQQFDFKSSIIIN